MSESPPNSRDRAREGALIGATLLGVGGLALRYALRRNGTNGGRSLGHAAQVGALMALAGAVAGALIGGAIEDEADDQADAYVPPDAW